MLANVLFVLAVGRLFLYLVQSLPPVKEIESPFFHKLFNCDLCLGVWVYFCLCCFFHVELTSIVTYTYIPVVSEMITGATFSFLVHLLRLGWKVKFGNFDV